MVALAGNNEVIGFVSELLADMDWMWDFESGLEDDNIGWEAAKADSIEEIVAQLVDADKILDSAKLPVVDADLLDFGVWTADADGFAHTLADNSKSWAIHLRPRIAADFHNSTHSKPTPVFNYTPWD